MGVYEGIGKINKFGENEDVAADTQEDVWALGGDYPYPETALITHVSQTVDQLAMRGAQIKMEGLDDNWDVARQRVFLDDDDTTTPVALATPLIRVWRADVGAPVALASSVRIHNAAETVDYAVMDVGHNQTMMAQYTVPREHTAYMTNYYASVISDAVGNKQPSSTDIHLFARDNGFGHDWQIKHELAIPQGQPGFQHFFKPYYTFSQLSDIKVVALCASEPGHVHAGFDLIVLDNAVYGPPGIVS